MVGRTDSPPRGLRRTWDHSRPATAVTAAVASRPAPLRRLVALVLALLAVGALARSATGGDPDVVVPVAAEPFGPAVRALFLTLSPNPFDAEVSLSFDTPGALATSLFVYDLGGHLVRVLLSAGVLGQPETLIWDGRGDDGAALPSGDYFAVLNASRQTLAQSVILIERLTRARGPVD